MKTYRLGQTSTAEHQAIIQQKLCDLTTETHRLRFVRTPYYRFPKKGEWYLSGCNQEGEPEVYVAPNDLSTKFHIMKPIGIAETHTVEVLTPLLRDKK